MYKKLTITLPENFYSKYRREKLIGIFLGSTSATRFGLRILAKLTTSTFFIKLNETAGNYAGNQKRIKRMQNPDEKLPTEFDSGYGYDSELEELAIAKFYKKQINENDITERHESLELYEQVISRISNLLEKNPSIKKVINFGVSYGHIDSILAKMFPEIQFIGIDRSKLTKKFNEDEFSGILNLSFEAADIFEFLKSDNFNDALLLSIRTLTVLPEEFVVNLYTAASQSGIRFICGFEQCGVSRQTDALYNFSENYQKSVLYRSIMLIHNYPEILKRSGYSMDWAELLKTRHSHEDYRLLCFISERHA